MENLEKIKGSIPPIITPISNGQIDYAAYANLVEFQINNGSHGILVNGTTAEPSTLSIDERNKLIDVACEVTANKIPIIAGTGSQSLAETKILTDYAVKAGVDSLLIVIILLLVVLLGIFVVLDLLIIIVIFDIYIR